MDVYTPHEGQQEVHDKEAQIKVLNIGRRWGKSRCGLFEMLDNFNYACGVPLPGGLTPPWHAWVVVPAEPQGRQAWTEMMEFIPKDWVTDYKQADGVIYLRGTEMRPWGMIELKSAYHPESLQSVGLDFLWGMECQDIPDEAFSKLMPTLRSPGRLKYALFEGIPSLWAGHWFAKLCAMAQRGRKGFYYKHATAFDNPLLTEEDKEEIRSDIDLLGEDAWKRMYMADSNVMAGYFKNLDACIAGDELVEPILGARYVGGLDLGRKLDPSVLLIMDAQERRVVYHRTWDMGESWKQQRQEIEFVGRKWGLERLVVDATSMGGDIFCEELRDVGLPVEQFVISRVTRDELLKPLLIAIEREIIQYPNIPTLVRQLRAFQPRKLPGGGMRVEAPPGEHDDEVFALALALTACDPPDSKRIAQRGGSRRYVQTQAEANGQVPMSQGAKMMRERKTDRMRKRATLAGVL